MRALIRWVFFRVVAEGWVETDSVGRHQWGWRLRDRRYHGRVLRGLSGRYDDRDQAFAAAVRSLRAANCPMRVLGDGHGSSRRRSGTAST